MNAVAHVLQSREFAERDDVPELTLTDLGLLLGRIAGVIDEIARDVRILAEGYERDRSSILRERGGHYPSPHGPDTA